MSKKIKTLQGAIICLALSLAMLLGMPGDSWADALLDADTSAFVSSISDLRVNSATSLEFNYETPQDGVNGYVYIWDTPVPTSTTPPVQTYNLPSNAGKFQKSNIPLNLLQGQYTVGITAGPYRDTVSSTQILNNGQPIQSFDSTLVVTSQSLDYIQGFFNSPPNVVASDNLTWFILRKGAKLGGGNLIAEQKKGFDGSAGLIKVNFKAGDLIEGEVYNLAMNPGRNSTRPISAGYVFTYRLN